MLSVKNIVIVVLVLNALFWGLYPHSSHCQVASSLGVMECPSHWIHLSMGLISFIIAIAVAQWRFIKMSLKI